MNLVNWMKVKAFQFADRVNHAECPFDPFTRAAAPKTSESLALKAVAFEDDLYLNFLIREGTIVNYRIPLPPGSPLDLGDQSLWHGVACWMEVLRYQQTQQKTSLERCKKFLNGLCSQQPGGLLIRGLDESGNMFWNASNDQATGHLLGLVAMHRLGSAISQESVHDAIQYWALSILNGKHALLNENGSPTSYGKLIDGVKTDPLRFSLILAIYFFAFICTEDHLFFDAYAELYGKYAPLLPYAKVSLLSWDTSYDTHRAAIHLAILKILGSRFTEIDLGLNRLLEVARLDGNIWVLALIHYVLNITDRSDQELTLKVLSEFDLDAKRYNRGIVNSANPHIPKTLWKGRWMAKQPLPRWQVSSQDFFWQRDLHDMDFREQGSLPDSRHNGLDYLVAYRTALEAGLITKFD